MSEFSVTIEGLDIHLHSVRATANKTINIDQKFLREHITDQFILWFNIGSERWCYYPEHPLDILIDLNDEIAKMEERSDHEICISGYPVGFAKIYDQVVNFFPLHQLKNDKIGECKLMEAIEILESARNDIARYIDSYAAS